MFKMSHQYTTSLNENLYVEMYTVIANNECEFNKFIEISDFVVSKEKVSRDGIKYDLIYEKTRIGNNITYVTYVCVNYI